MSPDNRSVETLLGPLNPVPTTVQTPLLDGRALADLDVIVTSRPVSSTAQRLLAPRRRRPMLLAIPGAAGLLIALAVGLPFTGLGGETAYAATPHALAYHTIPGAPDASSLLSQIAARTSALPNDVGTGQYAHVVTRGWSLFTTVDGKRVTSEVVTQRQETWTAKDGSGKVISTIEQSGKAVGRDQRNAGPGELAGTWPLNSLSPEDAKLAAQLRLGHPEENGPVERLVAIKDAYRQMPIPPAVRAGMLRYLAATPGLHLAGTVTDRAGRTGVAVSLDSDDSGLPTRYVMIIDPKTGQLLGSEDTLTTRAGALNVRIPSVINYEVYLAADYTDDIR